jgi:hypothetical protein
MRRRFPDLILLRRGEDAGFAGDEQEAVMGVAAEPARPVETAIVERTIETVAGQRFCDETR